MHDVAHLMVCGYGVSDTEFDACVDSRGVVGACCLSNRFSNYPRDDDVGIFNEDRELVPTVSEGNSTRARCIVAPDGDEQKQPDREEVAKSTVHGPSTIAPLRKTSPIRSCR